MMRFPIYRLWAITVLLIFSAGIVSAAAAGRKKKDRADEAASPEFVFMETHFAADHCTTWKPGDKFLHLSDELSVVLHPEMTPENPNLSFKGKLFTFQGLSEETVLGVASSVSFLFECDGIRYRYETKKSREEIAKSTYRPLLPDLIPLSMMEKAKELLRGKKLYVRTAVWYDENGYEISGRKYVPVTITDILPGNNILPIHFRFVDDTGTAGGVLGTLSPEANAGQFISFDRLFSFDNPREQYKSINDENWKLITSGQIRKGMTKEECRLSWGRPNEVKRIPTYSGLKEQWFYNTGAYLFFEDGLLTEFRQ